MTPDQLDAFALAIPSYQAGTYPGARAKDTSRNAAAGVAPTLNRRRAAVLDALAELREATPDEIAAHLGMSVLSTRPRCTELAALCLIVDTGARRPTAMGGTAAVYRLANGGPRTISGSRS